MRTGTDNEDEAFTGAIARLDEAWQAGARAYIMGLDDDECPFDNETLAWEWQRGFHSFNQP